MHVQAAHRFIRYKPLVIFSVLLLWERSSVFLFSILVMQFGSSCNLLLNCHNMVLRSLNSACSWEFKRIVLVLVLVLLGFFSLKSVIFIFLHCFGTSKFN